MQWKYDPTPAAWLDIERSSASSSSSLWPDREGVVAGAVQEVTVQFNLCNEPWLKYSMLLVSDQGLKPSQWTSARLHREVLFLETARHVPAALS